MKNKKIISLIATALTVVTLTGCNFGKNNINKESNEKQENKIEKQEPNNTELDKKIDEENKEKKSIEKENKEIKKTESDKDKVNIESKKENKPNNSSKPKVEEKKDNKPKAPQKPKYQEKREYKKETRKEYPKKNSNIDLKPKEKKEPIKENKPMPKKNIPQVPKQTHEVFISDIEQIIFRKVNEERAKLGIAPLAYNYTMQKYARDKSLDMGSKNYFSHEDLSGKLITENMKKDGVSFNAWGENIGYVAGYTGNANIANQFMNRWMNSTGHRKNILSQNFKSIGIGVYKIGNKYYATQEFYR